MRLSDGPRTFTPELFHNVIACMLPATESDEEMTLNGAAGDAGTALLVIIDS